MRAERCHNKQPKYGCNSRIWKFWFIKLYEVHSTLICKECKNMVYYHYYTFRKPDAMKLAVKTIKLWNKKLSKRG